MSKSKDSVDTTVLQYLTTQNRPYSVNDITANLQLGKAACQKAVDSLVQNEKVREKVYGKQKVYLVDQSNFKEASPDELRAMQTRVDEMEQTVQDELTRLKETQNHLKGLLSTLTTEQAQEQVAKIAEEVEDLQAKYKTLSETTVVVDVQERRDIRKRREGYIKDWRVRKRKCMDMLEIIMENCPKSRADLFEDIGVEEDESPIPV